MHSSGLNLLLVKIYKFELSIFIHDWLRSPPLSHPILNVSQCIPVYGNCWIMFPCRKDFRFILIWLLSMINLWRSWIIALSFSRYHWCSLLISITILLKSGNLYTYWCTSVLAFPLSSHLSKKMHLQFVMFWWAWAWVYFTIWVWPCAVKASQVIMTELNFNFFFQPIFQRYPRPAKEYQSFSLIYNERSLDLVQISSHPVFVCFFKENSHRCSLEKSVFSFWVSDAWVTTISWI